jgi:YVTN family beta-propeller protein
VSVITSGMVTGTVAAGSVPVRLAINDLTDHIYVVNISGGGVTVIDGKTNSTTSVTAGAQPSSVAIDELRNKIYVQNGNGPSLTVIDGKNNTSITLGNIGSGANIVAADVLTNRVYVTTAYPTGSTLAVFSGVNGTFPASLLDELMGPVTGLN